MTTPSTPSGTRRSTGPVYSTRFKLVAAAIAVVVAVLSVVVYLLARDATDPPLGSGGSTDFVESLLPPNGSQVLQQSTVGIDLASGWEGILRIGGQDIPEDQLTVSTALNQVTFTPGPDKVLEALSPGRLCAQALVWRSAAGRANSERTVSWCFEVV